MQIILQIKMHHLSSNRASLKKNYQNKNTRDKDVYKRMKLNGTHPNRLNYFNHIQ